MYATVCLALTAALTVPVTAAHAEPKPTYAEAKKKLDKLSEQVDQLVQKYNAIEEDLSAAKLKYTAATRAAKREAAAFEKMRSGIAQMANTAYTGGDLTDVSTMLAADDPQSVLDQAAVFTHLSTTRAGRLTAFVASAQRLEREQAQAEHAYKLIADKAKELRSQKASVEKSIKKQKALVDRLGGDGPSSSGPGFYTGPATGSARAALNYAYAQIGKPYEYGAEGPNTFDCSGLTMMAWRQGGVSLPRTTYTQYDATRRVAWSDLQPGDLVFFSNLGHMGIYAGNGKMVHAPRTGKNVEEVNISSGYYKDNYYGAGRP